jgi:hypothetical protein
VCRCAGPLRPGASRLEQRPGRHQRAMLPRRTRRCRTLPQQVRKLAPQLRMPRGVRWRHRPRWVRRRRQWWARHWCAGSPAGRLPRPIPARRAGFDRPLHLRRRRTSRPRLIRRTGVPGMRAGEPPRRSRDQSPRRRLRWGCPAGSLARCWYPARRVHPSPPVRRFAAPSRYVAGSPATNGASEKVARPARTATTTLVARNRSSEMVRRRRRDHRADAAGTL